MKDLSFQGMGVVDHPKGQIFFVPGVWPGDEGEFAIVDIKKRYGFAKLQTLIKKSPHRVKAPCSYQGFQEGSCGGCPWMIADYQSQLDYKERLLKKALERAQVQTQILPIISSQKQLAYRNRAQFKTDGEVLGFISSQTKKIVDLDYCLILNESCNRSLSHLRDQLPNSNWKPQQRFLWNFIDINDEQSLEHFQLNQRLPFKQGNSLQNEAMKRFLKSRLELNSYQNVLELFSGSGNFTELLQELGLQSLMAIEVDQRAVQSLSQKKLSQVTTHCANLFSLHSKKILEKKNDFDFLFLDPPREGFSYLTQWVKSLPVLKLITYVSCDFSSMLRDIRPLVQEGWDLELIQAFDLFPHTPHLELISFLRKK